MEQSLQNQAQLWLSRRARLLESAPSTAFDPLLVDPSSLAEPLRTEVQNQLNSTAE